MTTYDPESDQRWLGARCRDALRMAEAWASNRHLRVLWQERAADYRATLVDRMRRRHGWTLAEIVAGTREARS